MIFAFSSITTGSLIPFLFLFEWVHHPSKFWICYKYFIQTWGSVSMLSHCFMPGFLLMVLFFSWRYRLAFLSLRRMLKINLSVYWNHIYRKLTFGLFLLNLSPHCAEYDVHKDVACEMIQCLAPFLWMTGSWRRIHVSVSPRESCIKINVFHVNNQANDNISARLQAITCFRIIKFLRKYLCKIKVSCLSLRHFFVSFVRG